MASSTNSSFLSSSSGHVDNLINYVLDVKPYHTKLTGIVERYVFSDTVSLRATDSVSTTVMLFTGYDTQPYDAFDYDSGPTTTIDLTNLDFPFYLGNFIGLKVYNATTLHPGLSTVNDWVRLQFSYYLADETTIAPEPHLADVIKAVVANTTVPVMTLTKAGIGTNSSILKTRIVFDSAFYSSYLMGYNTYRIQSFPNELCIQEVFVGP